MTQVDQNFDSDRFTIIGQHDGGGIGVIFLAKDEELQRRVALKVLNERYSNNAVHLTRFEHEAQITANLEHPAIIPVYARGWFENDCPYYAMKLVKGQTFRASIEDFHRDREIPNRQAWADAIRVYVERLATACDAIQYAHSCGVIHRDIKPRNILVGEFGETIVIDWGLAKTIDRSDQDVDAETAFRPASNETLTFGAVGTPKFMSPEQAEGRDEEVGPLSDVYSLGVTLYCLLTNSDVFTSNELQSAEMGRPGYKSPWTRGVKPKPPSDVVGQVPRNLEAICLKAINPAPSQRYATAADLATDLKKWLANEPVSARLESLSEKCGRWMYRHRAAVQWSLAALVVITIAASIATIISIEASIQTNKTRMEREISEARAVQFSKIASDSIDTWQVSVTDILRYWPGNQRFQTRLLAGAVADYEKLAAISGDNPLLELERYRTLLRLGDLKLQLNQPHENEFTQARVGLSELVAADPTNSDFQIAHAQATIGLAKIAEINQRWQESDDLYVAAIESLGSLGTVPEPLLLHDALGTAQLSYGASLQRRSGRFGEAQAMLDRARDEFNAALNNIALREQTEQGIDLNRADSRFCRGLANACRVTARLFLDRGELSSAQNRIDEAIEVLEARATQTSEPEIQESLAGAQVLLAEIVREKGDINRCMDLYVSTEEIYGALHTTYSGIPSYRMDLALHQMNHGVLLHEIGRTKAAAATLHDAVHHLRALIASNPAIDDYRQLLCTCLSTLGDVLRERGDEKLALDCFYEAMSGFEALITMTQPSTASELVEVQEAAAVCSSQYAQLLQITGEPAKAEASFTLAIEIFEGLVEANPDVPRFLDRLATTHFHRGVLRSERQKDGSEDFRQARRHWETLTENPAAAGRQALPHFDNNHAWFLTNCPSLEVRSPAHAIKLSERALSERRRNPEFLATSGAALFRADRLTEAIEALRDAADARPDGSGQCRELFFLAMAQAKLGTQADLDAARRNLEKAIVWMKQHRPANLELKRIRAEAEEKLIEAENSAAVHAE